jgi:hypothetical protein
MRAVPVRETQRHRDTETQRAEGPAHLRHPLRELERERIREGGVEVLDGAELREGGGARGLQRPSPSK